MRQSNPTPSVPVSRRRSEHVTAPRSTPRIVDRIARFCRLKGPLQRAETSIFEATAPSVVSLIGYRHFVSGQVDPHRCTYRPRLAGHGKRLGELGDDDLVLQHERLAVQGHAA